MDSSDQDHSISTLDDDAPPLNLNHFLDSEWLIALTYEVDIRAL